MPYTTPKSTCVIVPVQNQQDTLEEQVQSLLRLLNAATDRFEVVIVDDGSTDRTPEIGHRLADEHQAVKFSRHEQPLGTQAVMHTGLFVSVGILIFVMDKPLGSINPEFTETEIGRRINRHPDQRRFEFQGIPAVSSPGGKAVGLRSIAQRPRRQPLRTGQPQEQNPATIAATDGRSQCGDHRSRCGDNSVPDVATLRAGLISNSRSRCGNTSGWPSLRLEPPSLPPNSCESGYIGCRNSSLSSRTHVTFNALRSTPTFP